jgi:hypothetical protein
MLPSREQIENAAYDRWLRRHRSHGHDRDDWIGSEHELTYLTNYETVAEYSLESSSPLILGNRAARRCRFCERNAGHTEFSAPRQIVQGSPSTSLFSCQICDECQADCRDPLAAHCETLWKTLAAGSDSDQVVLRGIDSLAVFKSLVTSAMLIMPDEELAYFTDTLEWVNNPDHEYDAGHFAGTECHLYVAPFLREQSWASLARRIDDESPFPYMVCFLCRGGIVVQISVPLCVRDHDLDGRSSIVPVRSLTGGEGPHFRATSPAVLRLVDAARRARTHGRHALAAR